ncbi:hypothetical protein ACIPJ2_18045 [Curtobacterium sp. NPDC090217]|uniref:hypothetical protein n=1 Tax=Curtobacterium sp. NPDC090217 TaxID=3363970 RepID=UPI00381E7B52
MSETRSGLGRSVLRFWIVPVLLVIAAFASVAVHVPKNTALSPLDEYVYVDYIAKVPSEGVVAEGEPTGAFAREALVCLGNRGVPTVPATTCADAGKAPASVFPMAGKTSADIYTPLYFWVTRAFAQPLVWAGMGLIDAASYVGALWLAGAVVLLVFAMRRFRVREPVILGLGLALIASPAAYWSSTYISTDAPSLAVGAALALLVARYATGSRGLWLFPLVAAVGVAFKVQNIAAVGIAALAVLSIAVTRAVRERGPRRAVAVHGVADGAVALDGVADGAVAPGEVADGRGASGGVADHVVADRSDGFSVEPADTERRRGWGQVVLATVTDRAVYLAVGSALLALVVQVVWLIVRADIQAAPPPSQGTEKPLHFANLVTESLKFLQATPLDPTGRENGVAIGTAGILLSWLVIAGVLGCIAAGPARTGIRPIAWSSLVVALALGPLLVLGTLKVSGYYFELPSRYGLSMLPFFLVLSGVLFSRYRAPSVLLCAGGVVLFGASLLGS